MRKKSIRRAGHSMRRGKKNYIGPLKVAEYWRGLYEVAAYIFAARVELFHNHISTGLVGVPDDNRLRPSVERSPRDSVQIIRKTLPAKLIFGLQRKALATPVYAYRAFYVRNDEHTHNT